eukprot:gene14705-biopygen4033
MLIPRGARDQHRKGKAPCGIKTARGSIQSGERKESNISECPSVSIHWMDGEGCTLNNCHGDIIHCVLIKSSIHNLNSQCEIVVHRHPMLANDII